MYMRVRIMYMYRQIRIHTELNMRASKYMYAYVCRKGDLLKAFWCLAPRDVQSSMS